MDLFNLIWNFNVSLFYLINLNLENPILNNIMPIITLLGSLYIWIIVLVILFIFGGKKEKNTAILGFITILLGATLVSLLKYTVAEPRPFMILDHVNLLGSVSSYSFPSGHTATAFAAAFLLGKKYRYIFPLMIFACLVAFTRVYMGVHYPLDILFGAIIGILSTWIVLKYEKIIFNIRLFQSYKIEEHV